MSEHFLAIWRRALNQPHLDTLTPELITSWASSKGLVAEHVEARDVGAFRPTPCIVVTIGGERACFPTISPNGDSKWEYRRAKADTRAALWEKVEWFSPLWIPRNNIDALLSDVTYRTREEAISLFDYHTSTLYTLTFQATCIVQIMPLAPSVSEFCAIAREAYLAFYSGYRAASIAALIPAIEGSLTRMASNLPCGPSLADKIDAVFTRALSALAQLHFRGMWVPREYLTCDYLLGQDDRVFVLETFRRWLHTSFFCHTGDYQGQTWLNRHLFAHGTSPSWQEAGNFRRLLVALATLAKIETWQGTLDQEMPFFPEMNEDSQLLWRQSVFHTQGQMLTKLIEEKHFHEHGRLVPGVPSDDGVLLRKNMLSEDCIKDLVRPLRDAGWDVTVEEPDEQALLMRVVARADGEEFGAALLYTCATDNAIYKKLAEDCKAILYRGAPFLQNQYAHGINVHVGPVAGWQPPLAPRLRTG